MKLYTSIKGHSPMIRHPHSARRSHRFGYATLLAFVMISATAFSDEWRPRHALVPPTGVMNLTEPAGPADVLLPGPDDPAAANAWRAAMKAWREERLTRLRYDGAQYDAPDWPGPSACSPRCSC